MRCRRKPVTPTNATALTNLPGYYGKARGFFAPKPISRQKYKKGHTIAGRRKFSTCFQHLACLAFEFNPNFRQKSKSSRANSQRFKGIPMAQKTNYQRIGQMIEGFCQRYSIPLEFFHDIINDQKVLPMLRGKGLEYSAYLAISQELDSNEWTVHKLNSNPQPGSPDKDISVIHRRTGIELGIESKSAVRGSMSSGARAKLHKGQPHFKVKCHRSRSSIKLADTSNDRYRADAFDVLVTTPSNGLFQGNTIGEALEILDDKVLLDILYQHYQASSASDLLKAAGNDWRFVIPSEIADNEGFIERTPYVLLKQDPLGNR
jgi:hypothetical protein